MLLVEDREVLVDYQGACLLVSGAYLGHPVHCKPLVLRRVAPPDHLAELLPRSCRLVVGGGPFKMSKAANV